MRQSGYDAALVTQMRAGSHYMCAALRVSTEATIHRPEKGEGFVAMDDSYIRKGLHGIDNLAFPQARPDRNIYFCHYYHPQKNLLSTKPHICLIGFPLDSFYSDGVVFSGDGSDPAPSGPRASSYLMRFGGREWKFLESYMTKNADWLATLSESCDRIILRYEDLIANFEPTAEKLGLFVGGFANELPRPTKNPRRSYWTQNYANCFDREALNAMWKLFGPSIERFYPECADSLKAAL